jgi:hypothetical protein
LSMMFRILNTCKFTNPKIKCSKNTCNCSHALHIMEMCNNIISQFVATTPLLPG